MCITVWMKVKMQQFGKIIIQRISIRRKTLRRQSNGAGMKKSKYFVNTYKFQAFIQILITVLLKCYLNTEKDTKMNRIKTYELLNETEWLFVYFGAWSVFWLNYFWWNKISHKFNISRTLRWVFEEASKKFEFISSSLLSGEW